VANTGVQSSITIGKSNFDVAKKDASIAQIAAVSSDGQNIVEIGWRVDPNFYNDKEIHLYAARYFKGAFLPASASNSGYKTTSGATVTLSQKLSPGGTASFAVAHKAASGNLPARWALSYNGIEFGHFPDSVWFDSFIQGGQVNAQGEIISARGKGTCTDMGNGALGSSASPAKLINMAYLKVGGGTAPYPNVVIVPSEPSQYNVGNQSSGSLSQFGFGGPGIGKCAKPGQKPLSFDNTCNADLLAYLNGSQRATYNASGSQTTLPNFGTTGDIAMPGNYLGSGFANLTVFRPSTGQWYANPTNTGTTAPLLVSGLGYIGDVPLAGDFNGDGLTDAAYWRKYDNHWLYYSKPDNAIVDLGAYGDDSPQDVFIVGDANADGLADRIVYRYSNSTWYFAYTGSGTNNLVAAFPGVDGYWLPQAYDFNGDGAVDEGMYDTLTGHWLVRDHYNRQIYDYGYYGGSVFTPVVDDFNCDGRVDLGVYNNGTTDFAHWFILMTNNGQQFDQGYLYREQRTQLTYQFYPPNYVQPTTPILIDTAGDGFDLSDEFGGVDFDITATEAPMHLAWTEADTDDAWLVLDRDGNGRIDNGKELFGNFTPQPSLALAEFDKPGGGGNGDGRIDANDAVFAKLRLWKDTNHDGVSATGEVHTLRAMGVAGLGLNYAESRRTDAYGNQFRYRGLVQSVPGAPVGRVAYDVLLRFETKETAGLRAAGPESAAQVEPRFELPPGGFPITEAAIVHDLATLQR
jgi:elongation factor P hydroxylase